MILKAKELAGANEKNSARSICDVLHVINGEHFSGAERVQDLLSLALPQFGYQADFACLKLRKFADVRQSTSKIVDLEMRSSFDLTVARQIVELVRKNNYKIIHAHTPRTAMVGSLAARWLNLPFVYHVHSPVGRDSTRRFRNRINTWVETRCLKAADAMICVSNSLAEYMKQIGHNEDKINVVCNGVPACYDLPERSPPTDRLTVGTMALFRPRKGIELLLQSLGILRDKGVNVRLRAVGGFETPEYEQKIMQLVSSLKIDELITWTGFQSDINNQLRQMDLFVLPSLFGEGLPMVVLESMAQGVPVIASDVEGIPEAVRDGIDGLIFESGSASDLAAKVVEIATDSNRWLQMNSSCLERQRERFSEKSMAEGVAKVYDEVLKQS